MVTQNQFADITLNEVDAAKVAVGNPATLTFAAVPGLTIAGTVADISPLGTVSQGGVSYTVKIGFATQDSRIKPGMSVAANMVRSVRQNVLVVPSAAVHSAPDGTSYVLAFDPPLATSTSGTQGILTTQTPMQVQVTVGLTNKTQAEITAGLSAGQQIVNRTIMGTATAATTPAASGTGGRGGFGGGGGGTVLRGL